MLPSIPTHDATKVKWVRFYQQTTQIAQDSLLARDPDFAVVPVQSPKGYDIAANEDACPILPPKYQRNSGQTLRVIKCDYHLKPNITREEAKVLKELRQHKERVIQTPDKEMAMVVLNKQDYINKAQDLLPQRHMYRLLTADLTNKYTNKLINMLKPIKAEGGLGGHYIQKTLSNWCRLPKFYGLPQDPQKVAYGTCTDLAKDSESCKWVKTQA